MDDPVFLSGLLATAVPFVTALLVKYQASAAVKATVATVLSIIDAGLVVWLDANDAGVPVDVKTLILALAAALTVQRVVHSQVNEPYRVRDRLLPNSGIG